VLPVREMASAVVDVGLRNPLTEDGVTLLIKPAERAKMHHFKSKVQKISGEGHNPTPGGKGTALDPRSSTNLAPPLVTGSRLLC